MYRRPKFLEILLEIREEMSREAEFDIDLFVDKLFPADQSKQPKDRKISNLNRNSSKGFNINTETIIKKR